MRPPFSTQKERKTNLYKYWINEYKSRSCKHIHIHKSIIIQYFLCISSPATDADFLSTHQMAHLCYEYQTWQLLLLIIWENSQKLRVLMTSMRIWMMALHKSSSASTAQNNKQKKPQKTVHSYEITHRRVVFLVFISALDISCKIQLALLFSSSVLTTD